MTRNELLLAQLSEECNEVAQRVIKALRFGLSEIQPGQPLTNAQRINDELNDLMTVHRMLCDAGCLERVGKQAWEIHTQVKEAKVEKYLAFSLGQTGHPESEVPHA